MKYTSKEGAARKVMPPSGSRPINGVKNVHPNAHSRSEASGQLGKHGGGLRGPNPTSMCC